MQNFEDNKGTLLATSIISAFFVCIVCVVLRVYLKLRREFDLEAIATCMSNKKYYRDFLYKIPIRHKWWLKRLAVLFFVDLGFKIINVASIFIVYVELINSKLYME